MMESSAPPQRAEGFLPDAPWRVRDFVLAFLAGLAGAFAATIAVYALGYDPLEPLPFAAVFAGQAAATLGFVLWLSRQRGTGSLAADVGFVIRPGDWWGVPAGMALQIAIALITLPLISLLFPDGPPEQGVSEIAGTAQSLLEQIFIVASVAVAAPIVEEILYRGMLLSILRKRLSPWVAVVVSAGVFSLVHAALDANAIAAVPGLFLLGVVLATVTLRRGNLSLAIALHSGINLLAAIVLLWGDDMIQWLEQRVDEIEGIVALFPW